GVEDDVAGGKGGAGGGGTAEKFAAVESFGHIRLQILRITYRGCPLKCKEWCTFRKMVEISPSPAELASGKWESEKLAQARRAILDDGFVVLKDVADKAHLEILRERMLADVEKILNRPDAPFNFNKGNLQQDPPPFEPYL